jgi:hypothetical protein
MKATTPKEGLGLLRALIENAVTLPWEFARLETTGLLVGHRQPSGPYPITGTVCTPLGYSSEARPYVITALALLNITSDPQLAEHLIRTSPRGITFLDIDHPDAVPKAV